MNEVEEWKDIEDYEGLYQVSTTGKVRSLDRIVQDTTKERVQHIKGRILKQTNNGNGYKLVFLSKNRKRKNKYVHRLVAEAFIDNPKQLREVNHKNLNKSDNSINNLEWISSVGNKRHFLSTPQGEKKTLKCGHTRYLNVIKNKEQLIIQKYIIENNTISKIAKDLKLNPSTVTKVLKLNNITIRSAKDYKSQKIKRDNKGRFLKKEVANGTDKKRNKM